MAEENRQAASFRDDPSHSPMASLLSIGQTLKGRLSTYSVVKELHNGAVYLSL